MNKLILYHYTSNVGMNGILKHGAILKGSLPVDFDTVQNDFGVSLTSDESPIGHGLPDGREISKDCAERLAYRINRNGKYFCQDHTKFRLEIHIREDDEDLIYLPDLMREKSELLDSMEVSGYHPMHSGQDDFGKILFETLLQIKNGFLDGKSKTWWVYKNPIPIRWIHEVRMTLPSGDFVFDKIQLLFQASLISR